MTNVTDCQPARSHSPDLSGMSMSLMGSSTGLYGGTENSDQKRGMMIKYISNANNYINMFDADNHCGGYYAMDLTKTDEPVEDLITDDKGRVHFHRKYAKKTVCVFVSESNEFEIRGKIVLLPRGAWQEVKQVKGANKGQPLTVYSNGDIWTYKPNMHVKIFVRKENDSAEHDNTSC